MLDVLSLYTLKASSISFKLNLVNFRRNLIFLKLPTLIFCLHVAAVWIDFYFGPFCNEIRFVGVFPRSQMFFE